MMELFINEKSLNEQFGNDNEFLLGLNIFIDLLQAASEIREDKRFIFFNEIYFSLYLLRDTRFDITLKRHHDANWRFFENLQKLAPTPWTNNKLHNNINTYEYFDGKCNDTSIAEIAERSISIDNYKGLLMNFIKSSFGESVSIKVIKNKLNNIPINVDCSYDRPSLYNWLYSIGYILPNKRKFEHHRQKHDRKRPTAGNSILLCTEPEAQKLLDTAVHEFTPFDNRLYNFDTDKQMIIIFNRHVALTYHGYHTDDLSIVPSNVKKQLKLK